MTTISEATQIQLDALDAEDMACAGSPACAIRAAVDVTVTMNTGRSAVLRLCPAHARLTVERGLRNATVGEVRSIG